MYESSGKLTVYFDAPFWAGVFERIVNGKLSVCKVTFGAEPKDYEVWAFVLKNYGKLKFSPSVNVMVKKEAKSTKDGNAFAKYHAIGMRRRVWWERRMIFTWRLIERQVAIILER